VDLNYPEDWPEKYDVVIDGGTAEHCFNVGQVFANILSAVRPDGGIVVHVNPLNMMNHGFWNISPTAYADFYRRVHQEPPVWQVPVRTAGRGDEHYGVPSYDQG
jgi:hypothetical protein